LIVATGNVTGGNLVTSGALSVTGNANVGNIGGARGVFTSNVSAGNLSVTGNATLGNVITTVVTTGANTTAGTLTGNWSLSTGSRLIATYADLAEYYEADKHYVAGTVLEFGGDKEVTIAEAETARVAGVVSSNPAYAMNGDIRVEFPVLIALAGRVPCKIKGKVSKGDMMISAGDGYAKASKSPEMGTVIGKALANFDGEEGIIEVVVGRM
jgi:hypothetical protein